MLEMDKPNFRNKNLTFLWTKCDSSMAQWPRIYGRKIRFSLAIEQTEIDGSKIIH